MANCHVIMEGSKQITREATVQMEAAASSLGKEWTANDPQRIP
jgi:hypothetical protein